MIEIRPASAHPHFLADDVTHVKAISLGEYFTLSVPVV